LLEKEIEILDSIMGSGKTTNIIKWMNSRHKEDKFIYVSPLLSEVERGGRIDQACEALPLKFSFPTTEENETKSEHLLQLLQNGVNIACTHSLYLNMSEEHFKAIEDNEYIVIIDEELGVINDYDIYSQSDLESLLHLGCVEKQENDGMLVWKRDDEHFDNKSHAYFKFKRHVENGLIYCAKRKNSMMVTQLPIKLFSVAKRTIILTYMFEGNILSSFLKLKGIRYKPFTEVELDRVDKSEIRKLITLVEPKGKWKALDNYKLSNTWYVSNGKGNAETKDILFLTKFIESFARQQDCNYKTLMYTFPKYRKWTEGSSLRKIIKPKGLIDRVDNKGNLHKCWIAVQTRATNDYAHKTHLLHLYNRYPNQSVKAYLQDYGVDIDDNVFAVSELVQWVWRSSIRNNKEIVLCLASVRMRKLFSDWLDN